jgi:hypothetical protein
MMDWHPPEAAFSVRQNNPRMDWKDWQRVLKWRALEEGDADGVLVSAERRREATAHTRAGLASEEIKGDVAG